MALRTLLYLTLFFCCHAAFSFEKVVIWGHKLHTHTHSYIHERFHRAFQHLGYSTYWFDNEDNVETFDFSNTLFITEGQVDQNIPLRKDCLYVLHNCNTDKYEKLQWIKLGVYTDVILTYPNLTKIDECIYYDISGRTVYMPWASDLLPHEIDAMKKRLPTLRKGNDVQWIGTCSKGIHGNIDQIKPFKSACKKSGHPFVRSNAWSKGIDRQEMLLRLSDAFLAPAIVGKWQAEQGYIPCRIFINLSCGQLGVTNSRRVYEFFNRKVVYNSDTYQLFYDAQKRLKTWTLQDRYELMDLIKQKHTYLNRIQTLLNFFDLLKKNTTEQSSSSANSQPSSPQPTLESPVA